MQVVKYEINKNTLTVGFKEDNFVVYSQLLYDDAKTKPQLLQDAYVQVKSTIAYEKTQTEHSIVTDEIGEEFVPEIPQTAKVIIDSMDIQNYFSCLQTGDLIQQFTAKTYDQYGAAIDKTIAFTLGGIPTNVVLNNGLLTVGQVDNDYDLILTASCEGITDTLPIYIRKYIVPVIPPKTELEILQEKLVVAQDNASALGDNVAQFMDYIFTNIPTLP